MSAENLEIYFQDEERASGVISSKGERVPWTAVRSGGAAWFIVLHGHVDTEDASVLQSFLTAIRSSLQLKKAA
ncbi:MAG: hypothetical protein AAB229_10220 [Candidatus Hydrogenedentota bacterium]